MYNYRGKAREKEEGSGGDWILVVGDCLDVTAEKKSINLLREIKCVHPR